MFTNYKDGSYKQYLNKMIEFQLQVDLQILTAVIPKIEESFGLAGRSEWNKAFPCPNLSDLDLANAWDDGLQGDFW